MACSADQIAAIEAYTGTGYHPINVYLREDGFGDPIIEQQIQHLDQAIANNPAPAAVIVYRGVGEAFAVELAERGLTVGDIIQDKGFLSTSRRKEIAVAFMRDEGGMLFAIRVPPGSKALDVAPFSAYSDEAEILLAREARLRVIGYSPVDDTLELEMLGDE